ncbi:dual specificity protein phosphatase 18-like [Gouania willdenowi]|uniref:dual specificity protein phosphatase 18-like n=1 Tax=Gouania willdenowi TaxID=441366 RepID=UPI001054D61C|nr:dual specificity protein phosphatase 18-like [Gouania willdenowi]
MHHIHSTGLSGLCKVTDCLYLSNSSAANDVHQLNGHHITCIITVTETRHSSAPPGMDCIHIPVCDSPEAALCEHFEEVSDRIEETRRSGGRVLVHCNAGVSRSAALCLAYLMKHCGMTLLEAHTLLRSCRPIVRPNYGFWKQLIRFEMDLRGMNSVQMVSSSMGEIPDIYQTQARNMTPL